MKLMTPDARRYACVSTVGPLVKGDVMLAQKIALETDEQNALAAANKIPLAVARPRGALPQFGSEYMLVKASIAGAIVANSLFMLGPSRC